MRRIFPFAFLACCVLLAAPCAWASDTVPGFNYPLPADATVNAIAVDAAGNTYLTGATTSSTFPATPGAVQQHYAGGQCNESVAGPTGVFTEPAPCHDAFVVKLDPTGAVLWATYLGGSGDDAGQAIAVDAQGDVYVCGITAPGTGAVANNFPTSSGSAFPASATSGDGFVVELNASGSQMIFGTYLPGLGTYNGYGYGQTPAIAMTIDSSGSAYVAGSLSPAAYNFPTTEGAFQASSNAQETGLILKLNPAGSALAYATYVGATDAGEVSRLNAIAVDQSGNAYVAGAGAIDTTPGVFLKISGDSGFAAKLNDAGSALVYATFLNDTDNGVDIKVDSQGEAYILGQAYCTSTCIPGGVPGSTTTLGVFEPASTSLPPWAVPSGTIQFLTKLNAQGSAMVYGTYVSGALVMDLDASGDAYVAGFTMPGFPVSADAFEQCYNSNDYAAELNPTGALLGATYFGGPGTFSLNALAVGAGGLVSIAPGIGNAGAAVVTTFPIENPSQQAASCMPALGSVIENAADYSFFSPNAIAPGELVTLRGAGIGPETGASPLGGPALQAQLDGTQVYFGNIAAPLLYAQSNQINVQVPWEIAGQNSTQVQVVYNGATTNTVSLSVIPSAPGLFSLETPSVPPGTAAVLNADGSINTPTNCAHPGDEIAFFGTGGGPTNPPGVTGGYAALNAGTLLTLPVKVQIAGLNALVDYAGAAPGLVSGVFQINVQVPALAMTNPFAQVGMTIGNQATMNPVSICVVVP